MKKSNHLQSSKCTEEKTFMRTVAAERRLPSTPISAQILTASRIALATANSLPRMNELMCDTFTMDWHFITLRNEFAKYKLIFV
ncbi:unnamed protein product [Litomosoides sigmodontis]|uniref:Uncharacterized protein n=1 Tax=Litomosoides sigmodontis TaxID=42156 RepID=A0A3P6UYX2_LITSI|nr:unnamed protein product [Litomosoides sigmodontis]